MAQNHTLRVDTFDEVNPVDAVSLDGFAAIDPQAAIRFSFGVQQQADSHRGRHARDATLSLGFLQRVQDTSAEIFIRIHGPGRWCLENLLLFLIRAVSPPVNEK